MIDIVPATTEIVKKFYGETPPKTVHAIAAVRDGEILGIAGIFSIGMAWMMFSDMKPEILADKRAMVRALRVIRKLVADKRLPVYANPDPNAKGADILIEHAGVEPWPPYSE